MTRYIGAIDQGTTSSRFIVFDRAGNTIAAAQREHRQIYPKPGWVEHDPIEIRDNTMAVIEEALRSADLTSADLVAVGITNQRETTVLWDRATGLPVYNAVVWQDTRVDSMVADLAGDSGPHNADPLSANPFVGDPSIGCSHDGKSSVAGPPSGDLRSSGGDRFRAKTGLPLASYFSALKLRWLLDNVPNARTRAAGGELAFGTVDSWILWHLTGLHITDVTNASRTQLMDLATLEWDDDLLETFGVPRAVLPRIVPSSAVYGQARAPLAGVPVAGILGDQQAALMGQACFQAGEAKNTYGTGCFLLMHTGTTPTPSKHGLITTVAAKLGDQPATYALEGSIAVTGALVQWLRDNLRLIKNSAEVEALALSVPDNGDVYFVPAFSGLYAPYWRADARGTIAGLTRFASAGHIARAALEATAYQTLDVVRAMERDSGIQMASLRVDGGMVVNRTLMQFQADMLDVPVVRPSCVETTALGAAYAAGLAVGYWSGLDDLRANWAEAERWAPAMDRELRAARTASWHRAVDRSMGWR